MDKREKLISMIPAMDAPQVLAICAIICESPVVMADVWSAEDVLRAVSMLHNAIAKAKSGADIIQLIGAVNRLSDLYVSSKEKEG